MGTEDYEMNPGGSAKSLTRFGIGARGVDVVSRTTSSGNTVSYPLYDGHGNNVGSLLKNGASFTVADEKTYDAWGGLRSGGGADKGRYCASIGHKQDDESGLVYMRARYYEPTSGRFVSEDVRQQGAHWFGYCGGDPVNRVDESGCEYVWAGWVKLGLELGFGIAGYTLVAIGFMMAISKNPLNITKSALCMAVGIGLLGIGYGASCTGNWVNSFLAAATAFLLPYLITAVFGAKVTNCTHASIVGAVVLAYTCLLLVEMAGIMAEEMKDYTDNHIGG
jgi:RHS repeat-associated protein